MGIPAPEPGLVLNYAYLWHDEHLAGHEEGRKDRPAAIVLTEARKSDGATVVTVLPITHTEPVEEAAAVEIPRPIKLHLGLDESRSWIVLTEANEFVWPGYDLRKIRKTGRYDYGFLPPTFFNAVRNAFVAYYRTGRMKRTERS